MLFRVLAGRHTANKVVYAKDDIVESDRDLVALFGDNKFKREIELEMKQDKTSPADSKAETTEPPKSTKPKSKSTQPKPKDVTKDYPLAADNGLLVTKIGRKYFVADEEDPDTPLNDKGLKLNEVEGFIEDQFEAE